MSGHWQRAYSKVRVGEIVCVSDPQQAARRGVFGFCRRWSRYILALGLCTGLVAGALAQVPDSDADVSVYGGRGVGDINIAGVRLGQPLGRVDWAACTGFGEADVEYWRADQAGSAAGELTTVGALAGCRFLADGRFSPEIGFGARLLSHVQIIDDKDYSTAFQFQTMVGLRARLDDAGRYFVGVRARHISNAGIRHPNSGINTMLLSVGLRF